VTRTITLADIRNSGFDTNTVIVKELNGAVDPDSGLVLFNEGDILLIGRGAASLGRVLDTQSDVETSLFTVKYAFRQGHKWIRWQDAGYHSNRVRRVFLVPATNSDGSTSHGTASVQRLSRQELIISFDKPVDITSWDSTTVNVKTGTASVAYTTATDVALDGTMTYAVLTFPSALTAGSSYVVSNTVALLDIGATAFDANTNLATVTVN